MKRLTWKYEKEIKEPLHTNIRVCRIACGYSQDNIAELIGCTRPTYTYIESGKTSISAYACYAISKALEISLEELFNPNISISTKNDRPAKSVSPNPEKIGQLSPDERLIIAYLRINNDVMEEIIKNIRKRN